MVWLFHRYYPARKLLFFLSESFLIFLASLLAFWFHVGFFSIHLLDFEFVGKILFVALFFQVWLYYYDLYSFKREDSLIDIFLRLLQAAGVATFLLGLIYFIFPSLMISNWSFMIFLFAVLFFAVSWRLVYFWFLKNGYLNEKVALVGYSSLAKEIMEEIYRQMDCGFTVSALFLPLKNNPFFEDFEPALEALPFKPQIYYGYNELYRRSQKMGIKKLVVTLEDRRGNLPINELLECRMRGLDVVEGETFYEHLTGKIIVEKIRPSWLIFHGGFCKSSFTLFLKRVIGIILSSTGLLISAPVALIIAILIKIDSPGPVLFVQERVGKDGRIFKLYKFRSMRVDAEKDAPKWASKDDPRVTRVGKIIRKLRLDEIPQMWNVLKGDMSFVGPRPERPYFVEQLRKKIPFYDQRHTVHPGITGWAQICYPYGASEKDALEKLKYDLYYIKYMSTMFDLFIIFKTIQIVLFGKGAR